MKNLLRYVLTFLLVAAAATPVLAENKGEKEIHALLNDALNAFRAKDLDKMMSFYDHSASLVAYDLGDVCLNPLWVAPLGNRLAVSCGGRAVYSPPTYSLTSVDLAGLVLDLRKSVRIPTSAVPSSFALN